MQLLWYKHVSFRARSRGLEGRARNECTSFPHSFPPGALTVLHVETLASNTCFDFVKSCHLCLSQCSSDSVNLNASTFVIKPHLGDTDPGGFFPTSASPLV